MEKYMAEGREWLSENLKDLFKKKDDSLNSFLAINAITHSMKSIDTIYAMREGGYSRNGSYGSYTGSYDGSYADSYDGSYDDGSYDGGSYRRGRSATTGRFVSRRSGGYSRTGDFHEKLEELMNDAPDEATRKEIQRLISKME